MKRNISWKERRDLVRFYNWNNFFFISFLRLLGGRSLKSHSIREHFFFPYQQIIFKLSNNIQFGWESQVNSITTEHGGGWEAYLPRLTLRATYLRQRTKHDDFLDEKTLRNFENGSGLGDKLDGVWQFSFSCIRFFKLSKWHFDENTFSIHSITHIS